MLFAFIAHQPTEFENPNPLSKSTAVEISLIRHCSRTVGAQSEALDEINAALE